MSSYSIVISHTEDDSDGETDRYYTVALYKNADNVPCDEISVDDNDDDDTDERLQLELASMAEQIPAGSEYSVEHETGIVTTHWRHAPRSKVNKKRTTTAHKRRY